MQQITAQMLGKDDCLRLLMYLPPASNASSNQTTTSPAMVWFHGGWSVSGDANGLFGEYHGSVLARLHNLTVLSVQYRLALFGFLMLEGPAADAEEASADALGFQDQALAMQWVQENAD